MSSDKDGNISKQVNTTSQLPLDFNAQFPKSKLHHLQTTTPEERGRRRAEQTANDVDPTWCDRAYEFLEKWVQHGSEFMTEDLRLASTGFIEEPPSLRAWGGIVTRAQNEGLIEKLMYRKVKNEKAHSTPAAVWRLKPKYDNFIP